MGCGWNFKLRAISNNRISASLHSPSLPDARAHTHTHTIWLLRILAPNFSSFNSLLHPDSFILFSTKVWVRVCSIFKASVPQHLSRQLCFLTAFQMDASGLIVYHGTHTQALISPYSFFGHRVSLCFSGHGNLSSKHILWNTKDQKHPITEASLGRWRGWCSRLSLTAHVSQEFVHSNSVCSIILCC